MLVYRKSEWKGNIQTKAREEIMKKTKEDYWETSGKQWECVFKKSLTYVNKMDKTF